MSMSMTMIETHTEFCWNRNVETLAQDIISVITEGLAKINSDNAEV